MAAAAEEAKKLLYAGKAEEAAKKATDAVAALKSDDAARAAAAKTLIKAQIDAGKMAEAKKVMETELAAFQAKDFTPGVIIMLVMKSAIFQAAGKFDDSVEASRDAWPLSKKSADKILQAEVLVTMVGGLSGKGPAKAALRAAKSSMTMVKDSGDKELLAEMLLLTSQVSAKVGEEAVTDAEEALSIYKELGSKKGEGLAMNALGMAQSKGGKFEAAISTATAALDLWRPLGLASGTVGAIDVLVFAQAEQGQPSMSMQAIEDEYAKMITAGISPKNEVVMLEKMVSLASERGYTMEAISKMEKLITAMQAYGDKAGEAMKTFDLAEMHFSVHHVKDAAHTGDKAVSLFSAMGEFGLEERAKQFVTTCYVALGQHSKAPYRSEAVMALKNFIKAVESRDISNVKEFEKTLDKASSAIKESEINAALEALFEKDPSAMKFMEELGWDVSFFKTPQHIYQFPHEVFYFHNLIFGMGFGPTFRGVYPYRKGKRSDPTPPESCIVAQMPPSEAWAGQLMFRHGLMDACLQGSDLRFNPPY